MFAVTAKGKRFLALSSFVDEGSMAASEHIRFLDLILDQYGLAVADMIAIVCDNMETNRAISRCIGVPMIGCAAHRFNLAVRSHVQGHRDAIDKVAVLMKKLKIVKRSAVLRSSGCRYRPVALHELRWSGLHRMLKRYDQLYPFLYLFSSDTDVDRDLPSHLSPDDHRRFPIVSFIPNATEHCEIMELLEDLDSLQLATQRLQSEALTLSSVRGIFDEILVDFPSLRSRLGPDACIVESPTFEAAVVKVQNGSERCLTSSERSALTHAARIEAEQPQ